MEKIEEPKGFFKNLVYTILVKILAKEHAKSAEWDAERKIESAFRDQVDELVEKKYKEFITNAVRKMVDGKLNEIIKCRIEQDVDRHLHPEISQRVSEEYLRENMLEILKKIDVTAVSNSITLGVAKEFLSKDKGESYSEATLHPNYLSQHQGL